MSSLFSSRRQYFDTHTIPVVLSGNTSMQSTGDMSYPFQQTALFLYLTGIEEPDWMLVIEGGKSTLIAPPASAHHTLFDGGLGFDEAQKISGVEAVLTSKQGNAFLKELARNHKTVYTEEPYPYMKHVQFAPNPAQEKLRRKLRSFFSEVLPVNAPSGRLRALKQPDEITLLREAIRITTEAFHEAKETLREKANVPVATEYELEAVFTSAFRRRNAYHAYDPIVAGGRNALTLHYNKNGAGLPKNGLVLIDIGARVGGYCADITRTYAIGTPSEREKAVHVAVEKAHREIVALIKPGTTLKSYQEKSDEIMKRALKSLELLQKPSDYRKYFPHAISHGLGIDVHESLGGYETFMPGMVLTVEPGIYIPEEGIGVRIEDDILVTETGNENLSVSLPVGL